MKFEEITTDYLVIGSGISGFWFAWKAGKRNEVLLVTKKESMESNTNYAQGGIAAAVGENDSPKLHHEDTLRVGAGLAHPDIVKMVTESGPRLVRELWELGVGFSAELGCNGQLKFDLGKEGGHLRHRIIHAKDATGQEIERKLLIAVSSLTNITILEQHFATDLIINENGVCAGAIVLEKSTGKIKLIKARATLLATGGIGKVYRHTTNPAIATGDGIAMAYRLGARIANMEFIQFHPTSLYGYKIADRVFLISEAVRGEGAVLKTKDGKEFMSAYHPDGSLAPRDIVARAIAAELLRRGDDYVLLDCSPIPGEKLRERFPNIFQTCINLGIDITKQPIPVVPAAHYVCGGVAVDSWGETDIKRLFCAGESAFTGIHGANRLASNSLLEALVFAERTAIRVESKYDLPDHSPLILPEVYLRSQQNRVVNHLRLNQFVTQLQTLMWQHAGIIRSDRGLLKAQTELDQLAEEISSLDWQSNTALLELRNMLIVAQLIVRCAQLRLESRGLHYNQDHPLPEERFERDTIISKEDFGHFLS